MNANEEFKYPIQDITKASKSTKSLSPKTYPKTNINKTRSTAMGNMSKKMRTGNTRGR